MKDKYLKYCFILSLTIFSLYFIGFILNFVAFTNIHWIVNDNYIFGLFQYCTNLKSNEIIDDFKVYVEYDYELFKSFLSRYKDFKCFLWTNSNRPKFFETSLILQSSSIFFQLILICTAVVSQFIYNKSLKKIQESQEEIESSITKNLYWNYSICTLGIISGSLLAINKVMFLRFQKSTDTGLNNEALSWCYWTSLAGTCITTFASLILLIHTYYFKKNDLGKKGDFKYTMKHIIDAYKKSNNPFYSTNSYRSKKQPNSAFASYVIQPVCNQRKHSIDDLSFSSACSQKQSCVSESATTVYVESQNYEFPINHNSSPTSSTQQNFIYSQAYPGNTQNKNEKKITENKNDTVKMHVLPYGSLSGNCGIVKQTSAQTI